MPKPIPRRAPLLLCVLFFCAGVAFAEVEPVIPGTEPAAPEPAPEPIPTPLEQRYLDEISDVETAGGAYDASLSQHLLGLGIAYQQDNKHGEAVDVLNRAAHITRVNEGLYSASNLPILELLIESYAALGDWKETGDRYHQMFQIHQRNFGDQDPRLLPALQKLAAWHVRAYLDGLGEEPLNHLLTARNLYEWTERIVRASYGEHDLRLAEPLRQRALVDYYLAAYAPPEPSGLSFGSTGATEVAPAFYVNSFSDGRDALSTVVQLHQRNPQSGPGEQARAAAEMGDWHQLFNRKQSALEWYRQAWTLGAQADEDSSGTQEKLFGKPTSLPVLSAEFEPAATPRAAPGAYILVRFGVDERGRAGDFEVLESVPEENLAQTSKLRRQLRSTRFRPRLAGGEPVATEGLLYRYSYQP